VDRVYDVLRCRTKVDRLYHRATTSRFACKTSWKTVRESDRCTFLVMVSSLNMNRFYSEEESIIDVPDIHLCIHKISA
jgi:hypothetical protein